MRSPAYMLVLVITVLGILSSLVKGMEASAPSTAKRVSSGADQTRRQLASLNEATVGSKTFALVDSYDCNNDMVKTVRKFFKANDAMFTECIADSGYKLYPYTGILPDAAIVTELVGSDACMSIIVAVVILKMPPCTLDELEMRAACETVLYYSSALKHGIKAPTSNQFYKLMIWRHHVNLAKASGKPYDGKSKAYSEFTKYMGEAITTSKVTVTDDFRVIHGTEEVNSNETNNSVQPSFNFINPPSNYFVGQVFAAENEEEKSSSTKASGTIISVESSDAAAASVSVTTFLAMLVLLIA